MCNWLKKILGGKCACKCCCKPGEHDHSMSGADMKMGDKPADGQKNNTEKAQ